MELKKKKLSTFYKTMLILILTTIFLILLKYGISFLLGIFNYKHNSPLKEPEGIITNQKEYEDYKFGFGNISNNGCGIVAVYNLLKLEGEDVKLADLIKEIDPAGSNFFALLGVDPIFLKGYLIGKGFDCKIYFDNFEKNSVDSRYVIYTTVSMERGHYELLVNNNDGTFLSINPGSIVTTFSLLNREEDFIKAIYVIK